MGRAGAAANAAKFEELVGKFPAGVADDSAESVGAAIGKSHRSQLVNAADPKGVERANDAVKAATGALDPHLRQLYVAPYIGPDKAIKSMEEFEALRFMRAESLTEPQVAALRQIRDAVGPLNEGTELAKVMSLSRAQSMLSSGDGNLTGFLTRKADLSGADNAQAVIDRLRLDHDGSPMSAVESYAVLETRASGGVVANSGTPRSSGFGGTGADVQNNPYPYAGNGFTASTDGHLTPEWRMRSATPMQPDVTVISFKNADGSPRVVSMGPGGSSDRWVMRQIEENRFAWEPLN